MEMTNKQGFSGMKIGIICIGDELLKGATLNTNLAFLGQSLLSEGMMAELSLEVPDREKDILDALELALEKTDLVLTTGGLGPTADDVTKEFIARRFQKRLVQHGETAVSIMNHWKTLHHSEMPPRVLNQSLIPEGAEVIPNRCGTAPGLILQTASSDPFPGRTVILLPGPPSELRPMFQEEVLPRLRSLREKRLYTKLFRICGVGESSVEERMLPVIGACHPLSVAYCASPEMVRLFLSSADSDTLGYAIREVRKIFDGELLSDSSETLAQEVLSLLRSRQGTAAVAESCTGGLLAKLFTDIPGSSDVFKGGVVAYSNEIKTRFLGVAQETLDQYGAVSRECALEMVRGISERFHVTAAAALTGIAGPDGGSPEKPVGLVWIAAKFEDRVIVEEFHLRRTREQIRERAAAKALNLLRKMILGQPCPEQS